MTWVVKVLGGLKAYALVALAAVGVVFAALWRARETGKDAMRREQAAARDRLQEHYDEIERENIDPAGAYDRLRGLSGGPRRR